MPVEQSKDAARLAPGTSTTPDAHGQAALLLAESLIHGLIARSALTIAEAVDIIETAIEIATEMIDGQGEAAPGAQRSLTLLQAMTVSLRRDLEE